MNSNQEESGGREFRRWVAAWLLIIGGGAQAAFYCHMIATRRHSYGLLGEQDYTVLENVRLVGPLVVIALLVAAAGACLLLRWRWLRWWVMAGVSGALMVAWHFIAEHL